MNKHPPVFYLATDQQTGNEVSLALCTDACTAIG